MPTYYRNERTDTLSATAPELPRRQRTHWDLLTEREISLALDVAPGLDAGIPILPSRIAAAWLESE